MKFTFYSWPDKSDFPAPGEAFSDRFVTNYTQMVSQLSQGLNGQLSMTDNAFGTVLTLSMAHGVPQLIPSPLPKQAPPFSVWPLNCDTQPNPTISMTTTATVNGVLTTAPAGYLFLTALYPLAEQFLYLRQTNTAQSIPSTTISFTTITFDATPIKTVGKNITYDGSSTVTLSAAGRYLMSYKILLGGNVGAGILLAMVSGSLSGQDWGRLQVGMVASSSNNAIAATSIVTAAAGETISLRALQGSGAAMTTYSSATLGSYVEVSQLSNDASLTANVKLFFGAA